MKWCAGERIEGDLGRSRISTSGDFSFGKNFTRFVEWKWSQVLERFHSRWSERSRIIFYFTLYWYNRQSWSTYNNIQCTTSRGIVFSHFFLLSTKICIDFNSWFCYGRRRCCDIQSCCWSSREVLHRDRRDYKRFFSRLLLSPKSAMFNLLRNYWPRQHYEIFSVLKHFKKFSVNESLLRIKWKLN